MSPVRVGVPRRIAALPSFLGAGKVWRNLLAGLPDHGFQVVPVAPDGEAGAAVDVWLIDGHHGPIATGRPVVAHLHEAPWDEPEVRATVSAAFIAGIDERSSAAAAQAAMVVTGSASGRDQLVGRYHLDPDRVVVALNGVDRATFHPDGRTAEDDIGRAGGDPGRPYVLFVGSVLPRKNLPLLREAVARVMAAGAAHQLVVVAAPSIDRGSSDDLLAAAIAPIHGRAVPNLIGGGDADIAAVMRGADLLCAPSVTEGFGLPVLEAMACGTAVVASDRGAFPEVVGDAGILVPPRLDPLADALGSVLADPARRAALGAAGARRADLFPWSATADGVARALRVALG